jgi:coenzyme Q-binding protein COQ10
MAVLEQTEISQFSPQQIFDLVADVESYPEFLPWCGAARIKEKVSEKEFLAELVIVFKALRERYTSRVTLTPPESEHAACHVSAVMIEGPFHHLTNEWQLSPTEDGGTRIDLTLEFQFKNALLQKLIGGLFERASEKMISAFRTRARELYG